MRDFGNSSYRQRLRFDEHDQGEDDGDHNPDWGMVRVDSPAQQQSPEHHTGAGDPTRWGSSVRFSASAYNIQTFGPQLINVDIRDAYPRNWQLAGTLEVSTELYASNTDALKWFAGLELIMGVGQSLVRHWVNLRALIDLAVPPTAYATGSIWYFPIPSGSRYALPWILPGGLACRSLVVRPFVLISGTEPVLSIPQSFEVSAALSPFAAGQNI